MLAEDIKGKITMDFDNGIVSFYVKLDGKKVQWEKLSPMYKIFVIQSLKMLSDELSK